MDNKYSVDDILYEIKKKKLQEKDGALPAMPQEQFPGMGTGGKNGVAFAQDASAGVSGPFDSPFQNTEHPPQQSGKSEISDRMLKEWREQTAQETAPPYTPPPFVPPTPAAPPAYTPPAPQRVDTPTAPPAYAPPQPHYADAPPVPPAYTPPPPHYADAPAAPPAEESLSGFAPHAEQGMPPPEGFPPPGSEPPRNPLDFDAPVQPLTDRAKMRKLGKNANTKRTLDFAKFTGMRLGISGTQAMPRLGTSRELDMDEIRNIDFGAADDYYDDDDDFDDDTHDDEITPRPGLDFSEYNSIDDRRDVAIDIARTKLWLVIRTVVTFVFAGLLIYLVLCGRYLLPMPELIAPENDVGMYLIAITALTVAVALTGSSTMGGGLIGLLKFRANSDTLPALAMLGAVGQCVFLITRPELINPHALTFYSALAVCTMFFNAVGKLNMISRIQANFKIISSSKPKKAVMLANDESFTREYLKGATRRPLIAYAAGCDFFTDFLALSYSDKYDVGVHKAVAPVCLLGAVVVGALTYILTRGSSITAINAIVAILCISATFSSTFIENVPLGKLTKKLAARGGMVSGTKAVEDFCDVSAIVLDEKDLFPAGHMEIHGIKTYSGRVDEAILDAASIAYDMDSGLSPVFLQMIGGNKKLLRKVDNAVFESGRGIIAWIDGRRVMLGNRRLMQSHGIELPEPGYEKKYAQQQGEPLFLSNAGELVAQLVVGYRIDEELAIELDRLGSMQKLLIVRTIDANLTPDKIWELYGYPEDLVQIMPAEQHEQFARMSAPRASELAEIAYTGKSSAMVGCILACVNARKSILSATVVQLVQIALGYGVIALLAFLGLMDLLTVLVLGGYQLFWFVVTGLVQRLRAA